MINKCMIRFTEIRTSTIDCIKMCTWKRNWRRHYGVRKEISVIVQSSDLNPPHKEIIDFLATMFIKKVIDRCL